MARNRFRICTGLVGQRPCRIQNRGDNPCKNHPLPPDPFRIHRNTSQCHLSINKHNRPPIPPLTTTSSGSRRTTHTALRLSMFLECIFASCHRHTRIHWDRRHTLYPFPRCMAGPAPVQHHTHHCTTHRPLRQCWTRTRGIWSCSRFCTQIPTRTASTRLARLSCIREPRTRLGGIGCIGGGWLGWPFERGVCESLSTATQQLGGGGYNFKFESRLCLVGFK